MEGARGVLLVLAMLAVNASAAVGGVTAAGAVFVAGWMLLLFFFLDGDAFGIYFVCFK